MSASKVMEQLKCQEALHIAVFAFPFGGHPKNILDLTRCLALLVPDAIFSFFNTPKSHATFSNITDEPSNIISRSLWDGIPEGQVLKGEIVEEVEFFLKGGPVAVRKAVAEAEDETGRKVSCVLVDSFVWFAAEMAEEMVVPWVAMWTSSEHALSTHLYTDLIREKIGGNPSGGVEKMDQLLSFVPGLSKVRVRDLQDGVISGDLQSVFSKMLHQMSCTVPRALAVITNTFQELDAAITTDFKSKFRHYLPAGPFSLMNATAIASLDSDNCMKWLSQQPPSSVVYISFGTQGRPSATEISAIADGVEETGVRFLWSIKANMMADLPSSFLERSQESGMGLFVPWAPQAAVLRHPSVGAFITHFGWNSVIESIRGGVPMIGRPFFGDQGLNGRLVEAEWEVGMVVDGGIFTKEAVAKAIGLVMRGDDGRRMKERISKLKRLMEAAVGPQGSSSENMNTLIQIITKGKQCTM